MPNLRLVNHELGGGFSELMIGEELILDIENFKVKGR